MIQRGNDVKDLTAVWNGRKSERLAAAEMEIAPFEVEMLRLFMGLARERERTHNSPVQRANGKRLWGFYAGPEAYREAGRKPM